jgi:hypothetical protein
MSHNIIVVQCDGLGMSLFVRMWNVYDTTSIFDDFFHMITFVGLSPRHSVKTSSWLVVGCVQSVCGGYCVSQLSDVFILVTVSLNVDVRGCLNVVVCPAA